MLILLPPSETKSPVPRGKPLELDRLSFPTLTPVRATVLDALIDVSGRADGAERLGVPAGLRAVVARNVDLREAPTAPAERVYAGVLYDALGLAGLDPAARRRARSWVVVISALWGAVRLGDRIPPYRLSMSARLPGIGNLAPLWRPALAEALTAAARRGVVVDCRSSDYAAAWRPAGPVAEQTVAVKVVRDRDGARTAVSHHAKHTRGLVARRVVVDGTDARRPQELAEALAPHFDVELEAPDRAGHPWVLQVVGE